MLAHQIMSRQVVTVNVAAPVADAIAIMLGHHVSGLPVVDARLQKLLRSWRHTM
jgi:CBS domain-containing protein